jgi:hypothetical protein
MSIPMLAYNSVNGQSIWDICLNTYGSIDFMSKLLIDNGIESIDTVLPNAMTWVWDESFSTDQKLNITNTNNNIIYATSASSRGSVLSIILNDNQSVPFNNPNILNPIIVTPPTSHTMIAEKQYIATGGESSIVFTELVNNNAEIIQITREVQILENSEYSFNPTTGTITLSGDTLATGEVLFIIYQTAI